MFFNYKIIVLKEKMKGREIKNTILIERINEYRVRKEMKYVGKKNLNSKPMKSNTRCPGCFKKFQQTK